MGMFQRAWGPAVGPWTAQYKVISVLAASGVVLGAWYMLSLVARVFFGPLRERKHAQPIADLSLREVLALVPLCVVIVWIGVQPKFILDRLAPSVESLAGPAMRAVDAPGNSLNKEEFTQRRKDAKVQGNFKEEIDKGVDCRSSVRLLCWFNASRLHTDSSLLRLCAFAPLRENPIGWYISRRQPFDDTWNVEAEEHTSDPIATEADRVP
jgi:hypothetical protein